jgi:3-deoxy-D-manno-octulosonic-acid transferase
MGEDLRFRLGFRLYEAAWRLGGAFAARHGRLREGYAERLLRPDPPRRADLWIQAASVGEAYLAVQLLEELFADCRPDTLLTANTSQGLAVLKPAGEALVRRHPGVRVDCRHFPFDRPELMHRAVASILPRLVVLLETELWPGLLHALRAQDRPCAVVNGRLSRRSLRRYRLWPGLWRHLRPCRVLAVSEADAERFGALFGAETVGRMPNLKFDRLGADADGDGKAALIRDLLPEKCPFVVFGSVRRPEEPMVRKMLAAVLEAEPAAVIGLFPRHLHRVAAWERILTASGLKWAKRSTPAAPAAPGGVVLWDTIGELTAAYRLAAAAFIGGSLAPLGGQNFLEALAGGLRPVIGPSWENFAWVGPEILAAGLLRVARDGEQAAAFLVEDIRRPVSRPEVLARYAGYVRSRQGGGRLACALIRELLSA